MIGLKIPYYEIKSLLGEGGMGNVYLVEHTQLLEFLAPNLNIWHNSRNRDREQIIANYHLKYFNKWTVSQDEIIELTNQNKSREFKYKKSYTIILNKQS
jgi:serine/threonine protein kinase